MNVQVRDTPDDFGARLRAARDNAGFSRAQLAQKSGVHVKTIERAETENTEPKATKLRAMCAALDIPMEALLGDLGDQPSPAISPGNTGISHPFPGEDTDGFDGDPARNLLATLDDMRSNRFANARRAGTATIDKLRQELNFLEPTELLELAEERGIALDNLPSSLELEDALDSENRDEPDPYSVIETRIIDTAIIGVDLHALEFEALKRLASEVSKRIEVDTPLFGWGNSEDIIAAISSPMKNLMFKGQGIDVTDKRRYSRR